MRTSLAVRIGLTVTVAFLAISVLAFGFMFRRSDLNAEIALPAPEKVAAIAALLDETTPKARSRLITALSSPLLEISILQSSAQMDAHSKPGDTPQLDEIRARYRAAMPKRELRLGTWGEPRPLIGLTGLLRQEHTNLDLRVGLMDGDWLVLRSREQFPMTTFGLPLGVARQSG